MVEGFGSSARTNVLDNLIYVLMNEPTVGGGAGQAMRLPDGSFYQIPALTSAISYFIQFSTPQSTQDVSLGFADNSTGLNFVEVMPKEIFEQNNAVNGINTHKVNIRFPAGKFPSIAKDGGVGSIVLTANFIESLD